jgi:hypothetical protein
VGPPRSGHQDHSSGRGDDGIGRVAGCDEDVEHLSFADMRDGARDPCAIEWVVKRKPSTVRTARLRPLRGFHLPPSKPLISRRSYLLPLRGQWDASSPGVLRA